LAVSSQPCEIKQESMTRLSVAAIFTSITFALFLVAFPPPAPAQSCQTAADLDDAARTEISTAGQRVFDMAAKGDSASMKLNSTSSLAADFSGIEGAVKDNHDALMAAKATLRSLFELEVQGSGPLAHGEFYCGVFGANGQTANSAAFYLDNLQPGQYAVVIFDTATAKDRDTFSVILQKVGTEWKLGGLYIKPTTSGGHDGDWFVARAREYKTKGQAHNAWLYFLQARSLKSALAFMSTQGSDQLDAEFRSLQPADIPFEGKTADLAAGTGTFRLTAMFPATVGNDLDLVVRYQAADISNTGLTFQNNFAVAKALIAKFPEMKDAFPAVEVRAADSTGRTYGSLVAMKDIK
jgi:hypothetical protein